MFRLLRFLILIAATFLAGILYERSQQRELCYTAGGNWLRAGICAFGEPE